MAGSQSLGCLGWREDSANFLGSRRCSRNIQKFYSILLDFYMTSGQNQGRPLLVVRISVFPEVSQMGYRYRVVPYPLLRFCATSERPRQSRTKLVLRYFCRLLIYIYIYIIYIYISYIYICHIKVSEYSII